MVNSNVTTITLDGETLIEFEKGYPYYFVTNKTDTDMYISMHPNIIPKSDGVYTVPAGGTERIGTGYSFDKFYIIGNGEAYIRGEITAAFPSFKSQAKGGVTGVNIDILMPPGNYASGSDDVILDLAGDMSDYALCVLTVSARDYEMRESYSYEDFQYLFSYNEQFSPDMVVATNLSGIILKSDTLTSSQIQINKNGLGRYYSLIGIR